MTGPEFEVPFLYSKRILILVPPMARQQSAATPPVTLRQPPPSADANLYASRCTLEASPMDLSGIILEYGIQSFYFLALGYYLPSLISSADEAEPKASRRYTLIALQYLTVSPT